MSRSLDDAPEDVVAVRVVVQVVALDAERLRIFVLAPRLERVDHGEAGCRTFAPDEVVELEPVITVPRLEHGGDHEHGVGPIRADGPADGAGQVEAAEMSQPAAGAQRHVQRLVAVVKRAGGMRDERARAGRLSTRTRAAAAVPGLLLGDVERKLRGLRSAGVAPQRPQS